MVLCLVKIANDFNYFRPEEVNPMWSGKYEVTDDIKSKIKEDFYAGFCDDEATKAAIKSVYEKYSYVCDTHTAVAVKVYEDYRRETGDTTRTLIASTASPYKFSASVLEAIAPDFSAEDEYALVDKINELSGIIHLDEHFDYKSDYTSYLDKKYE